MRSRAFRRHQQRVHQERWLSEVRNQFHADVTRFWENPVAKARFKEQPQVCSGHCCGNQRKIEGRSMQERRHGWMR